MSKRQPIMIPLPDDLRNRADYVCRATWYLRGREDETLIAPDFQNMAINKELLTPLPNLGFPDDVNLLTVSPLNKFVYYTSMQYPTWIFTRIIPAPFDPSKTDKQRYRMMGLSQISPRASNSVNTENTILALTTFKDSLFVLIYMKGRAINEKFFYIYKYTIGPSLEFLTGNPVDFKIDIDPDLLTEDNYIELIPLSSEGTNDICIIITGLTNDPITVRLYDRFSEREKKSGQLFAQISSLLKKYPDSYFTADHQHLSHSNYGDKQMSLILVPRGSASIIRVKFGTENFSEDTIFSNEEIKDAQINKLAFLSFQHENLFPGKLHIDGTPDHSTLILLVKQNSETVQMLYQQRRTTKVQNLIGGGTYKIYNSSKDILQYNLGRIRTIVNLHNSGLLIYCENYGWIALIMPILHAILKGQHINIPQEVSDFDFDT